jgi:hypothetical protein
MHWGGALLGNGSAPGQVRSDSGALSDAVEFFKERRATLRL